MLAWCSRNAWAYICPMQILFEDMQRTLPAIEITLPGAERATVEASSSRPRAGATDQTAQAGRLTELPGVAGLQITSSSSPETAERSSSVQNPSLLREDAPCIDGGRKMVMEGRRISSQMAKG